MHPFLGEGGCRSVHSRMASCHPCVHSVLRTPRNLELNTKCRGASDPPRAAFRLHDTASFTRKARRSLIWLRDPGLAGMTCAVVPGSAYKSGYCFAVPRITFSPLLRRRGGISRGRFTIGMLLMC